MAVEIERKFLVDVKRLRKLHPKLTGITLEQGYLSKGPVVRIRTSPKKAWITIKGKGKIERAEFEYEIPLDDGKALLALCENRLHKIRYNLQYGSETWEVDEFLGKHRGLWLAEIELKHMMQRFDLPTWVQDEVSHDRRYSNAYLAEHPKRFR